jgi:tRNA-splicing ligase RtcB
MHAGMMHRLDPFRLRLEPHPPRLVAATVYLPEGMQLERAAADQLSDVASIDPDAIVIATPDIHSGFGVPIGSVFATPSYVSPSAVGYDINCGMRLLTTPLAAAEADVVALAAALHRAIPLGEGKSNLSVRPEALAQLVEQGVPALLDLARSEHDLGRDFVEADLLDDLGRIEDGGALEARSEAVPDRAATRGRGQLATLGGGNHFVELQCVERVDDPEIAREWGVFDGQLVLMIHSGSRGFGHEIGGHFMKLATEVCGRLGLRMPNRELAYMPLSSAEGRRYVQAMGCAANYAFVNRQLMAQLARGVLRRLLGPDLAVRTVYDVPHNIAKLERHHRRDMWVHRKGATRAWPGKLMVGSAFERTGQPVLIPGSMGTASYLLAGVESGHESLYSVNHGAGRRMSRTAAAGVTKKGRVVREGLVTEEALRESMRGIHLVCEDRRSVREEAPAAYKDIDAVIATVVGAGLARTVARMRPLAVLKG